MIDTDDGEWMIVHPRELIATFLLPLPDPIALRDGSVLATIRPMDNARIQMLQPWLDELWIQRSGGSTLVPCSEMRDIEGNEPTPINWFNKLARHTSIQLHQTYSDAGLRVGLDPAIRVAKVISGPPLTLEEKVSALDESSMGSYLDASGLREMGLGAVTVAECAVGLRIVGDLPELKSPLDEAGGGSTSPFGPFEAERVFPVSVTLEN